MNRRGRASTWWLLAAVVVFTLIGAWFARNEDNEHDVVLVPPTIDSHDTNSTAQLAGVEFDARGERVSASTSSATNGVLAKNVPMIRISGIVVDEAGIGIPGVRVGPSVPYEWIETADNGTFDMRDVPVMDGSRLAAALWGYETVEIETPRLPTADVRLVMKAVGHQGLVRGVVLRADGSPAISAQVYLGRRTSPTDAHGRFSIRLDASNADVNLVSFDLRELSLEDTVSVTDALVAVEAGSQPAMIADFGRVIREQRLHPEIARLVLGPPTLAIAGRVVDSTGRPLAGWKVEVQDGSSIATTPVSTLEELSARAQHNDAFYSDIHGEFRVEGLLDREYVLRARSPRSSAHADSRPVHAGVSDLQIIVPPNEIVSPFVGRVVARDGSPIGGARVTIEQDNTKSVSSEPYAQTVLTDFNGRFEFEEVGLKDATLFVSDSKVVPTRFELERLVVSPTLELRVARRCLVRIALGTIGDSSSISALDANGKALLIWEESRDGDILTVVPSNPPIVTADKAESVSVRPSPNTTNEYEFSEDATEIQLRDAAGEIVKKQTVHLVPDQVTVISW